MKKLLLSIAMMIAILTSAIAQNCIEVMPGTQFSGPGIDGKYTLSINYQTDGNKTLQTIIKCGTDTIFTDCFDVTGVGTKVYSGLTCSSLTALSATFIRRTGSCKSAKCGPDVLLGTGVLASKFSLLSAKRIDRNTVLVKFNVSEETNVNKYIVKFSIDQGRTFTNKTIILPNALKAGNYETIIKL